MNGILKHTYLLTNNSQRQIPLITFDEKAKKWLSTFKDSQSSCKSLLVRVHAELISLDDKANFQLLLFTQPDFPTAVLYSSIFSSKLEFDWFDFLSSLDVLLILQSGLFSL